VKTLEQIKAELRKANPKWSDTKLNNEAQAAFVKQRSDTNKPTLDWKTPDSQQESGVLFGFGIKERVLPIDVESFIVNLVKNNKSAYAKVQSAVKQVTGRTINDPSSLGSWVGRLATNMIKDEEVAKNVTIESFLRAAVGAGGPSLRLNQQMFNVKQIFRLWIGYFKMHPKMLWEVDSGTANNHNAS